MLSPVDPQNTSYERVKFRLFVMPCCNTQICWVNPRLPTYCPECGKFVYTRIKDHPETAILHLDEEAVLELHNNVHSLPLQEQ